MAKGTVKIASTAEKQTLVGDTIITGKLNVKKGQPFQSMFLSAWALE